LDLPVGLRVLDLVVHHSVSMIEERRKFPASDIAILIDGRGQY